MKNICGVVQIGLIGEILCKKAGLNRAEVLNGWRTLEGWFYVPPDPGQFRSVVQTLLGLHSPVKHDDVCDYRTPRYN